VPVQRLRHLKHYNCYLNYLLNYVLVLTMMLTMICLEMSVIHIIHRIICYQWNVFFLIYEHALVILSSYPSTLHCCIKSHLLWESYISMLYLLTTDLLDFVCDCDFILNVAFLLYVRLSHE